MVQLVMTHLVGLISGGLHLLVDPALELVRVTEELLQVEGVLQGSTARLCTLMEGIASAQQLHDNQRDRMVTNHPSRHFLNILPILIFDHKCD